MESIGRLAAGIAHDFNNLLTVMLGYSQALHRLTAGEAREKVGRLRQAVDRATDLVRQLLAFSRKQPLQPQPLDLNQAIQGMSDMIRGVLNEQIEVVLELSPNLERGDADPHQLERIILNLCTNARDAMPNGGKLTIRTWKADEQRVGLEIGDSGQGMDEATQSRIFEPFFTTKPMGKGFGLGLATVYGTVKQSGGEISVRSGVQKGTVFTILRLRPDSSLTILSMALSIGFRDSVSFLLTIQATGLLTVALVGLPPTEYASLRWTHQHAGLSRRSKCYP